MPSLKRIIRRIRHGIAVSPRGVPETDFKFPASWEERTALAVASSDNALLPRHPDAGSVRDGVQVMHTGLLVPADGYCGAPNTALLTANKGVHEPQEERVFAAALQHLPPGALMVELGAYWAFYSAWFLSKNPGGRAILVEPDPAFADVGRQTLRLNGLQDRGEFILGWVGKLRGFTPAPEAREVGVDELVRSRSLDRIHILHADVQGQECAMLRGARDSLSRGDIDWLFISTHSMYRHAECKRIMSRWNYVLVSEADLPESYSYDGLLVYKRRGVAGPDRIEVSQRPYPHM